MVRASCVRVPTLVGIPPIRVVGRVCSVQVLYKCYRDNIFLKYPNLFFRCNTGWHECSTRDTGNVIHSM